MSTNAPQNRRKLPGSQWTAVEVEHRRRHWQVVGLSDDGQQAVLRAVIDGHQIHLPWRELRLRDQWQPGWT